MVRQGWISMSALGLVLHLKPSYGAFGVGFQSGKDGRIIRILEKAVAVAGLFWGFPSKILGNSGKISGRAS